MVRVQHGKRTTVLGQDEWDVLAPPVQEALVSDGGWRTLTSDIFDVRMVLETSAAAWAAKNATGAQLAQLKSLVDDMTTTARGSRDTTDFLRADRAFHDQIGRAAGNIVLRSVLRNLQDHVFATWTSSQITPNQLEVLAAQHARIASAVAERDAKAARSAAEAHLQWAKNVETRSRESE
jgi:DNA-binding FadR family transcriptional regulator